MKGTFKAKFIALFLILLFMQRGSVRVFAQSYQQTHFYKELNARQFPSCVHDASIGTVHCLYESNNVILNFDPTPLITPPFKIVVFEYNEFRSKILATSYSLPYQLRGPPSFAC